MRGKNFIHRRARCDIAGDIATGDHRTKIGAKFERQGRHNPEVGVMAGTSRDDAAETDLHECHDVKLQGAPSILLVDNGSARRRRDRHKRSI